MESGWAEIPVTLAQAILCQDMSTFYNGAQVCTAWRDATKAEGLGPKAMKFDLSRKTEVGDSWERCWQKLTKYAPKDLCSLRVCTPWWSVSKMVGEACHFSMGSAEVFRFCLQLSYYAKLTEVNLYHANLQDWSVFNCLPKGLVKLSFSTLTSKSEPKSLQCFDKLGELQELRLTFCPPDDSDHLVVTGDLSLPNLQCFDVNLGGDFYSYEIVEGDIKIIFTELTLTGVPVSCDSMFVVNCWVSEECQHEPVRVGDLFVSSNVDSSRVWLDVWLDFD